MERKRTEQLILKFSIALLLGFGILAMSTAYIQDKIYWNQFNETD